MSKPIKVAVIVPSLANKGPIRVVQTIINESVQMNLPIQFTILVLEDNSGLKINCPVIEYTTAHQLSDYDVVHTHGLRPDLIAYRSRKSIQKHIVTIHNYVFEDLYYSYGSLVSFFFGRIWVFVWRKADKLFCISEGMIDYYKRLTKAPISFIHNGIPKSAEASPISEKDLKMINQLKAKGKILLGSVCAVTRIKGIDQILQLLAIRKDLTFVLVGDGKDLKRLVEQSKELNVEEQCLFLGYRENAIRYFSHFDIFIIPSRSEGFGLTLLEAARDQTPTVCSDIPTFRELFSHNEVGFFQLENMASMGDAIDLVWREREIRSKEFNKKFLLNFTGEVLAKKYFNAYSSVIKSV